LQRWKRRLRIDGNNASSMMSNKGINASSTMARSAHRQQQQCHHDKGHSAIAKYSKDACSSSSMAKMPAHQRR